MSSKDKKDIKERKTKKKKRFSPEKIFDNNNFMLALSFISAFFIWVVMSMNTGETMNYPVADIPVTMELSEDAKTDNLSVVTVDGVSLNDFHATVRVKGNSVTVGSLKASDIQVYGANLGNIVASGTYPVTLMARQLGVKSNYDIVSVSPSEVTVVIDRTISNEFTIDASQIKANSPVEYYIGTPTLSQQTVTVTGPEQTISKAVKAAVSADVEKELEETTTIKDLQVKLYDADGNEIDDDSISMSPMTVDATIPVLVKKTVPITVDYLNAPKDFNGEGLITLEPSEIEIAASADTINFVTSISAGTIDLSTVSYGMSSMNLNLVMPTGVRNFNNIETATAKFDFTNYFAKFFVISQFDFRNLPEGLAAESTAHGTLMVRAIGPKSEIAELTPDDIVALVDLSDAKVGTSVIPVSVTIKKETGCWIYDSYSLNVTIMNEEDMTASSSSSESEKSSDKGIQTDTLED